MGWLRLCIRVESLEIFLIELDRQAIHIKESAVKQSSSCVDLRLALIECLVGGLGKVTAPVKVKSHRAVFHFDVGDDSEIIVG